MRGRKRGKVPARLLQLKQKFTKWRRTRLPGDRIPDRLWKAAARMAVDFGLNQTAKVLALDYYSLKQHVDRLAVETGPNAAFIEMPSPSIAHANECVIELEDGAGASMRMHLKGTDLPDVLALGRSFWDAR